MLRVPLGEIPLFNGFPERVGSTWHLEGALGAGRAPSQGLLHPASRNGAFREGGTGSAGAGCVLLALSWALCPCWMDVQVSKPCSRRESESGLLTGGWFMPGEEFAPGRVCVAGLARRWEI